MLSSTVRDTRDYNRALPAPIRIVHTAGAAVMVVARPVVSWVADPVRRLWAGPLVLAVVSFFLLWPMDGALSGMMRAIDLPSDLERELEAAQQFGAGGSLALTAVIIWLMDPARRRRLLDLGVVVALVGGACAGLKATVGRPRPPLGDPWTFVPPWAMYPIKVPGTVDEWTVRHAWAWNRETAALWSMPSSHTAAAAGLAVFLAVLYPRLRGVMVAMTVVVGFARMKLGAHWPTDVVAGAILGYAIARPAVEGMWGVRVLDWVWVRMVDRTAGPAYPEMVAVERARRRAAQPT